RTGAHHAGRGDRTMARASWIENAEWWALHAVARSVRAALARDRGVRPGPPRRSRVAHGRRGCKVVARAREDRASRRCSTRLAGKSTAPGRPLDLRAQRHPCRCTGATDCGPDRPPPTDPGRGPIVQSAQARYPPAVRQPAVISGVLLLAACHRVAEGAP